MDVDIIGKLNDWTLFTFKIYLDYFPGRLKYAKLGKSMCLTFWVPEPKVVEVIPEYLYPLMLHRFICETVLVFMIWSNASPVITKHVRKNLFYFFYLQEVITSKLIIQKIKWDRECEFISCWTIWHHPHCRLSITFSTGGQNTMKKQ